MEMKMRREEIRDEMNLVYQEIGKIFYETHRNEAYPSQQYVSMFMKMKQLYRELEEIENEELSTQGLRVCPKCQMHVTIESRFCNMCGYKFEDKVEAVKNVIQKRVCRACGSALEDDAVFCGECGVRQ